jgi:sialate O-acetylesterase
MVKDNNYYPRMLVRSDMRLAGIFSDRMILQRDRENHIFGTDEEALKVKVTAGDVTAEADVTDGRFDVILPPVKACFDIDITVEGSETIVLHEVCFGDVFLLSGQSNMELPIYRTYDASEEEAKSADYPYVRQYRMMPEPVYKDDSEYALPESSWVSAVQGQIQDMSAYGVYTFKRIFDKINVPIGLILNAQGGSKIEAWMTEEDVKKMSSDYHLIEEFSGRNDLIDYLKEQENRCIEWREATKVFDPSVCSKTIPEEAEPFTVPGIVPGITGSLWFYREFDVEEDVTDASLYCGQWIDADATYINGIEVGRTEYQYPPRKYPFDPKILHKGKNLIALRLIVERESGGPVPFHQYYIRINDKKISLEGEWKKVTETSCERFTAGRMLVWFPSILYKSMITTLSNISLKGVMWFQGESNAEEPEGYDLKFKAMVQSWRKLLGEDIPFIITELTDFIDPQSEDTSKVPDGWRSIQAQQLAAETTVDNVKCVPARDLGDMFEIHSPRKAELGARAAIIVEDFIY